MLLEQIYDIFERNSFEFWGEQVKPEDVELEVLPGRIKMKHFATLKLTSKLEAGKWEFIVSRRSLSGPPGSEILYISSNIHDSQPNVARVTDITSSALEGLGLNSWLIHKALEAFLPIAGPDPWIEGTLTEVDADNPRRVPFWQRHVDAPVSVDNKGNGSFKGPWVPGYNSACRKFVAVHRKSRGHAPQVLATHGYNLYEINGRLALKKLTPYQVMKNGRSGNAVWNI